MSFRLIHSCPPATAVKLKVKHSFWVSVWHSSSNPKIDGLNPGLPSVHIPDALQQLHHLCAALSIPQGEQ